MSIIDESEEQIRDANPQRRLATILAHRVASSTEQCKTLCAHAAFPDAHMHDRLTKQVSVVDEKNWCDWAEAAFVDDTGDKVVAMGATARNVPDRWWELQTVRQDKEEIDTEGSVLGDLSIAPESIYCFYTSAARQYTVWHFKARTGLMFEPGDETIDARTPLLTALVTERHHLNAWRAVEYTVV